MRESPSGALAFLAQLKRVCMCGRSTQRMAPKASRTASSLLTAWERKKKTYNFAAALFAGLAARRVA